MGKSRLAFFTQEMNRVGIFSDSGGSMEDIGAAGMDIIGGVPPKLVDVVCIYIRAYLGIKWTGAQKGGGAHFYIYKMDCRVIGVNSGYSLYSLYSFDFL